MSGNPRVYPFQGNIRIVFIASILKSCTAGNTPEFVFTPSPYLSFRKEETSLSDSINVYFVVILEARPNDRGVRICYTELKRLSDRFFTDGATEQVSFSQISSVLIYRVLSLF